jgi:metal-responsive CopG/Arc/MetJ family transcriptional regulator
MASPAVSRKPVPAAKRGKAPSKPAKSRVLIEFPTEALRQADQAAQAAGVSRSQFIRSAVEAHLDAIAIENFERELEASYKANADFNREIMKEWEHVDREAWRMLP